MRYTAHARTKKFGSDVDVEFEVTEEDLDGLDSQEREDYIQQLALQVLFENDSIEVYAEQGGGEE